MPQLYCINVQQGEMGLTALVIDSSRGASIFLFLPVSSCFLISSALNRVLLAS